MRLVLSLAVLLGALLAVTSPAALVPKDLPKTPAQKIVGTWRITEWRGHKMPAGYIGLNEYAADGKYISRSSSPRGAEVHTGKYEVTGNGIRYVMDRPNCTLPPPIVTICFPTDDTLVFNIDGEEDIYVRVNKR